MELGLRCWLNGGGGEAEPEIEADVAYITNAHSGSLSIFSVRRISTRVCTHAHTHTGGELSEGMGKWGLNRKRGRKKVILFIYLFILGASGDSWVGAWVGGGDY